MQAHSPLGGEESIQTIGTNVAANSEEDTIEMTKNDKDRFKAHLIVVFLEFSDKGINLCNTQKNGSRCGRIFPSIVDHLAIKMITWPCAKDQNCPQPPEKDKENG